MKTILATMIVSFLLLSCTTEPEPLIMGKDACAFCKMTLMDEKFGGEIVTKKGRVYKFDDINCLVSFYNGNKQVSGNTQLVLVVNYADPARLLNAHDALYARSEHIRSPMASLLAAFGTRQQIETHNKDWNGRVMGWQEMTAQFE